MFAICHFGIPGIKKNMSGKRKTATGKHKANDVPIQHTRMKTFD